MTKTELAKIVAKKVGYTNEAAMLTVDALAEAIVDAVREGHDVIIGGVIRIKTVATKARPARPGRNPKTGEVIQIPAKPAGKKVKVSAMGALRKAVK
jgi:DNA-binding protein HU-beta